MHKIYSELVLDFSLLTNSRYQKSASGFTENIVRTGAIWGIRGFKSYLKTETEHNSL